jgi:ABC-2 type transport system permease protein
MKKAWIVARHEFRVTVRRISFVLFTFVFPLFMAGVPLVMNLLSQRVVQESRQAVLDKPLGVVDEWKGLTRNPGFAVRRFGDEAAAKTALLAKEVGAYIVVPPDYLERGGVRVVFQKRPTILTAAKPPLPNGLEDWIVDNLLAEVESSRRARAKAAFEPVLVYLDASGHPSSETAEETVARAGAAYVLFFLLFMNIFGSSQYLLQGLTEEKENRVMEMVLASVTPEELLLGKFLGLGAAGLLQMIVWVAMGVAGVLLLSVQISLPPLLFVLFLTYFLLGYALFGSLMLGFGALGTSARESHQIGSILSLIAISPLFAIAVLVEAPNGTLATVFSYVPFTAPTTMIFRYVIDPQGMPWRDLVLSALVLAVSTFLAIRFSARLFRAGLLLYGKRPGLRQIWRWGVSQS